MTYRSTIPLSPLARRLLGHRFLKFGTVGFSGTLVNMAVLFLSQEYVFKGMDPPGSRLNLSLGTAIFVATVNNFIWNRMWTWGDRKPDIIRSLPVQFGQYFLACWLSIIIQFVFTRILAGFIHYLAANLTAIALAAVANYVVNDIWAFRKSRK